MLLAILAPPSARGQSAYYVDGFAGDGRCVRTCSNDGVEDQRCCFGKWLALSDFHSNGGQKALDWDYLLLEQMHLPQYCRLLEVGVDMTVSHKHVALYPHGTQ